MNLRQLETVYWAARLGSFRAAADRLHSTQSAVSMRILELEAEFGIQLFSRGQRTAQLTAIGVEFSRYAEEALELVTNIRVRFCAKNALGGLIRLGVVEAISSSWLPSFLVMMKEASPKLSIEIEEALNRDLVAALERGNLDVIFIAGREKVHDATTLSLGCAERNWYASETLHIPDKKLSAKELSKYPIITLSKQSHHYEAVEEWFAANGARFRRSFTCRSMHTCMHLASAGLGLLLIASGNYPGFVNGSGLRKLRTTSPPPPLDYNAVYRNSDMQTAAAVMCEVARKASTFTKKKGAQHRVPAPRARSSTARLP